MPEFKLTLQFTPQRLDYIAQLLMQRPWAEANPVLVDIQAQVAAQQPQPATPPVVNGHDPATVQ